MFERFNRTLLDMISVYTNQNQTDYDRHLPIKSAYRSCAHEKTGYVTNLLMLGQEANLPMHRSSTWYILLLTHRTMQMKANMF